MYIKVLHTKVHTQHAATHMVATPSFTEYLLVDMETEGLLKKILGSTEQELARIWGR
jgi:hypothetical protein